MKKNLFFNFVILILLNIVFKKIVSNYSEDLNLSLILKIFSKVILALLVIYILVNNKLFESKYFYNNIVFIIPLFIIFAYLSHLIVSNFAFSNEIKINYLNEFLFFLSCLSVGIFEELFFRVYIFSYVKKSNIIKSKHGNYILIKIIILTSLLFGIAHMSNLLNTDYDIISVINQIFLAISIGILFQSLFIRFKNILLLVFIHTLINFIGSFKSQLFRIYSETNNIDNSLNDFYQTFIFLLLINIILIIPLSFILIRPELIDNKLKNTLN